MTKKLEVPAEVEMLIKGRDFLERHGWTRNTYMKGLIFKKYCATGALRAANGVAFTTLACGRPFWDAVRLLDSVASEGDIGSGGIIHYNDFRARNKREVLAVFDKAILKGMNQ